MSVASQLFVRALNKKPYFARFAQVCYYSTVEDKDSQAAVYHKPKYATRLQYESNMKDDRVKRVADEHTGIKVTGSKRFFLVLTGLYSKKADVPDYVPSSINNRLGDRLRVVFIVSMVLLFFAVFLVSELFTAKKVYRDREAVSTNYKMSLFNVSLLKAAGIQIAHMDAAVVHSNEPVHVDRSHDRQSNRYSGIPAFPADMGNFIGKGEPKSKGKLASIMEHNPFVIFGCGLTTLALLGMIQKSFKGDKMGAQKYMQYRIAAQFFTVTALVAGVTLFSSFTPTRSNGETD